MSRSTFLALMLCVLCLLAGRGRGAVVFNNFGPTDSYQNFGTWFGTFPELSAASIEANSFIPSQSGTLDRITAALTKTSSLNLFTMSLRVDQSGHPAATLWQQTFSNMLPNYGAPPAVFSNLNGPFLDSGSRYWIVVNTSDSTTHHSWWDGFTGQTQVARTPFEGGNWIVYPPTAGRGMRVEVIPVPEPAMLGCAAIAALLIRRRKLQAGIGSLVA